jgi:hypothetical protein
MCMQCVDAIAPKSMVRIPSRTSSLRVVHFGVEHCNSEVITKGEVFSSHCIGYLLEPRTESMVVAVRQICKEDTP